jgi:ectoine hydroxylase-related dioxygenase (phytanoyl-CoA dioxygenase family)
MDSPASTNGSTIPSTSTIDHTDPSASTNGHKILPAGQNSHIAQSTKVNAPAYQPSNAEIQQAVRYIEEALPRLGSLKSLVQLDLYRDEGPLFVDTRAEPRILEYSQEEPHCSMKIKPHYIKQFALGKMDPRYGLFKFHQQTPPQGDISVAVKFCDLLGPVNPSHPNLVWKDTKLPEPTTDLEQVRKDIERFGYGFVKNALEPKQLGILQEAIRQQADGEVAAGVSKHDGGPNAPNQRIWTLINKGQEFLDLLEHPLIDEIVPEFLGDHALIHSFTANIARPGNEPMMLHTDQIAIQPPIRNIAFGLNIMWYLTDIADENGATRVFPGSHIGAIAPDNPFIIDGTVPATAPAGTALVFESRLWHATGMNRMTTGERPVILMFFMRSFIRSQENNFLSIRPEVEATISDRVRSMLGFVTAGGLGGVEGAVDEGIHVRKLENPVGPFRESHKGTPFRQKLGK